MKIKLLAIATIFVLVSACSPKVIQPETPRVPDGPISPELAEGRMLYENNCAKCHSLYNPNDFSAEKWTPIMLSMQKKAKISDEERDKIYAYLTK
jgi:hypothetical protein